MLVCLWALGVGWAEEGEAEGLPHIEGHSQGHVEVEIRQGPAQPVGLNSLWRRQ